ncbi:hypothetical protein [Streptomyces sp. NPDC088733]|uniref:hypothetical protein n=1 Tax=Streptomyces sp. NPDC088733 TaxID=3365880 RepID=UPI003827F10F
MGVYVGVRGFVECDTGQLAELKRIIASPEVVRTYVGGWGFPAVHHNWTSYAFYGAGVRESALGDVLDMMRVVARIPPDTDACHVTGLFLVSHEVDGMDEWQVRGGEVHIRPGRPDHRYLDT